MKNENLIQLECIAWFRNNINGVIIPIVNEATYKTKNFTILKGASDTIVLLPSIVLFIEFKNDKGKQSKDQIKFESDVKKLGL